MNSERIKEIQQETAYPDSVSVRRALLQVWNECEQQNKNLYSEEEVLQILSKFRELRLIDFQEWFNQFKKQ